MAQQELSNVQKKEWARMLYLNSAMTQKEIAKKVGVSENSLSNWVTDGKWEALKTTLLSTHDEQLKNLYKILEMLNKQGKEALEDDDPDTNPDADAIIKITKAIKYLEKDGSGMGETYITLMDFLTFIQRDNMEHAQLVNNYADAFIKERLNKF